MGPLFSSSSPEDSADLHNIIMKPDVINSLGNIVQVFTRYCWLLVALKQFIFVTRCSEQLNNLFLWVVTEINSKNRATLLSGYLHHW